jgi:hypothetical protein
MASVGRGITNKQASYLAALARELHVPYPGSGMSRLEASLTIADYQRQVKARGLRRGPQSASVAQGPADPPAAGDATG